MGECVFQERHKMLCGNELLIFFHVVLDQILAEGLSEKSSSLHSIYPSLYHPGPNDEREDAERGDEFFILTNLIYRNPNDSCFTNGISC